MAPGRYLSVPEEVLRMFTVDRDVEVSVPLTEWVSERFHAEPGQVYDLALGERGAGQMAKFTIMFVQKTSRERIDEDVQADRFVDAPPFVDFYAKRGGASVVVARYRAEDILRILLSES
jgi:hypothetical protein